jgi:glycosyltransferase involved in cell wall biosynthesis
LKIIYLHQYFTTPEYSGGVRSYEFSKRLVKKGHQVDLITTTAFLPLPKKDNDFLITREVIDGINIHAIRIPYGNKMTFTKRIMSFIIFMLLSSFYILKLKNRDLIYATSTPLSIGLPAIIGKIFHKTTLIFEVRDMWPDVPISMGFIKNKFLIHVLKMFELKIYNSSSKIIALSEGMKDEILKKGDYSKKVITIPNACDLEEFLSAKPLPLPIEIENSKVCLYAGTFGIVNNLNYLINLSEEIRRKNYDIKILLIGDGIEKKTLIEKINTKKLNNIIFITPPVSKKKLISYIKSVDCCISTVLNIPSLYNNSANKFFDALAAGKPIIINHGGWQEKVINENKLGLVLTENIEYSAKSLNSYLNKKDYNKDTILNFAKNNYSRELLFNKLQNTLQSSLKK